MEKKTAKEILESKEIEIFKAGKHTSSDGKTHNYSIEDLDLLVKNTNPDDVKCVVNHPEKTNYSLASFSSLRRVGNSLLAKLKDVKEEFAEAVKVGFLPNRSIRIRDGKYIEHLGFLTVGKNPAVEGLGAVEFEKNNYADFSVEIKDFESALINDERERFKMDPELQKILAEKTRTEEENKALKKQVSDFEAKASVFEKMQAENEKKDARIKELEEKVAKLEAEKEAKRKEDFEAVIERKLKNLKDEEKKKKEKEKLEKLAKGFESHKDFEEAINYSSEKKETVKVPLGADDFSDFEESKKELENFEYCSVI